MSVTLVAEPVGVAPSPTLAEIWHAVAPTPGEIAQARRRLQRKAASILAVTGVGYWGLVIANFSLPLRLLFAGVLVLGLTATGTGVMHDANHGSFSGRRWVNATLAYSMDLLGGSSWLWRFQHNHLHHGNPNVDGVDGDIAQAPFARLAPNQPWKPWYRGQYVYLWFLYGFMNLKNLLIGDFENFARGSMNGHRFREQPRRVDIVRAVVGKCCHLGWALVVPLMFNPWQDVLIFYVVCSWAVGFILAIVFQLAHCVDLAEFPDAELARRGEDFMAHQMHTTVDIACGIPALAPAFRWLVGGLDHQVEHHLAPRLPHTLYPALAVRFREACRQAGIVHRDHVSISAALASHTRWLRAMGRQPRLA
jgi:linoleoyl-CoA desaturase